MPSPRACSWGDHCEPQYGHLHYHESSHERLRWATEVAGQSKAAIQACGDERTRQRTDRRGDDGCRGFQESKNHGSTHCGVVLAVDEALNSVLDDNHLLTMPNGERIQFGTNVNLIFEADNLRFASPATISRLSVMFLLEEDVDAKPMIASWSAQQPPECQGSLATKFDMNPEKVSGSDRSSIPPFLSGGPLWAAERRDCRYSEAVKDETSVDLQTLEKEELDQKTNHRSLMKAKTRETLAVKVEKMESELFKAKRAPFVKVKGLITRLINRLQTEMSHMSHCDEETSMAAEKEDLDADTAKHSSTLVSRSITLDGEISTLQSELSALSSRQLQTDTMRADFAIETVARGVVSNIRFDSFIDAEAQVGHALFRARDRSRFLHEGQF